MNEKSDNSTAGRKIAFRWLKITAPFVLIMGAVFFIALPFFNDEGRVIKGLTVAGQSIEELTYEEAKNVLKEKAKEYEEGDIDINTTRTEYETITVSPSDMGIELDVDATLEKTFSKNRDRFSLSNIYNQTKAAVFGLNIPMEISENEEKMAKFVNNTLSPIHYPAENAQLEYSRSKGKFEIRPEEEGYKIDILELRNSAVTRAEMLSFEAITLSQTKDVPDITEEDVETAKEKAENMVNKAVYTIKAEERGQEWNIEKDDLASWVEVEAKFQDNEFNGNFSLTLSQTKIEEYLTEFAPELNTSPSNAKFTMLNGSVDVFSMEAKGYQLDAQKSAARIKERVLNESENTEISLVFEEESPEITSENIDNLGIDSLVGKGETDFAGSPESRQHNIRIGSDRYQGMLIEPGEEFSFNQNLGPVTAAAGYRPELVIRNNRTEPAYGGGLCQVSTTLFRAAINSGLEVTQRHPHSYVVDYYGTPGFDAAIYPPSPDLRFKNNTPGHILLQYQIEGTILRFEIYGQDDGRTVEVDGPHTYDHQPNGAVRAVLRQKVLNERGNIMLQDEFYSNYRSPAEFPVTNPLQ